MMNVSFMGLPQHLQRVNIYETNYRGVSDIIKDAGQKAGVVVKTTAPKVFDANPDLFDDNGHVSDSDEARDIIDAYSQFIPKGYINTCADFRDAVANCYKMRLDEDPNVTSQELIML